MPKGKKGARSFNTGAELGGGSFPEQMVARMKGGPKRYNSRAAFHQEDLMPKREETASLKGGLVLGTSMHPYDGVQTDSPSSTTGTSIFDPVLCELAYRWFCPPGGQVLDPFAGGSVRGIVAAQLGRRYFGVDLSERQCEANREQAQAICATPPMPEWAVGNSLDLAEIAGGIDADFVFSCPPYADLEVYSDDPADLSTMDYPDFRAAYAAIIAGACARLKPDRFACFVVGDVRDRKGFYRNFPGHTIEAFQAAGLGYYNEAILVTAAGSLPIRAGKQFEATRKLGKTHQNVLVFCKGDPRAATEAVGACEFGELDVEAAASANAALAAEFGDVL